MVRETRHLWVGNLPDNIREDRIREHFKRYGRVQNVKLLGRTENATIGVGSNGNSGICATVAFMDIKSASKAHNVEHVLDERTLTTEYYEPAAIPSAAGAPSAGSSPAGSGYSGSSSSVNSTPAPASVSRYHMTGGEDGTGNTCPLAASAAAPAAWRGTNDSATEYTRRGNTPAAYSRYQRNNSTAPYSTPPSNVERTTPHHRWYVGTDRGANATGGESTPSTPGAGTECGRRRRLSCSGSSRSDSSSPEPSDTSRASTPAAQPSLTHHGSHRVQHQHQLQWAATASGRPLAICVRNLPTRSTDSSLKDGLYHEYKKHGKVVWVKVVGQNADRYAVVRFKKPSDVEKALEVSQDKLFFGCKISVAPHQSCDEDADSAKPYETDIDEYHPKATRTLFIGNLEKDVTQQQLREKFKHFGRIIEIDIKKGSGGGAGYAFCQYASISSVVEAIRAMDGEYVGGSRVKLGFGKPVATTCVWVDGLTEHTEKQVLGAVSRCGAATSVCVDRAAGAALVHFEQAAAAGTAVRELRRVAAAISAAEPDHPRLCVDYASRECQEAFYEQLEKHGGSTALTGTERLAGDLSTRYLPSTRHDPTRYDGCGSVRSRASSFGRASSRTPRYSTVDQYDPTDYAADRRYRVYEELGSSPPPEETTHEDRLQSVVVSPHRARKHCRDSSSEDKKHSKERHLRTNVRRSRSGSRGAGSERHGACRKHRKRRDGSGSRAGTPLRDEPDALPVEPRRPPRERPPLPMSLPLPKFAAQLLRTAPPTPRPMATSAPDSPPRPPSVSSSSGGSAPHSPSLEERIRSLDEKYEKWSGSRALADAPDRTRFRHRLLDIDINEVKPSEVVRSLLAKRSVFDEDSERLESVVRPPSPGSGDSPRSRSSCSALRALRYPYSMTSTQMPHLSSHLVLNVHGSAPLLNFLDGENEMTDRPADPRLNRPERLVRIEKLGTFNESDYRLESRVRPRTPSTDRSQPDSSDGISPGLSKDLSEESKEDFERTYRDSLNRIGDDNKSCIGNEVKEGEVTVLDYNNLADSSNLPVPNNYSASHPPPLPSEKFKFYENRKTDESASFNSVDKSARDVIDMLLYRVEQNDENITTKLHVERESNDKIVSLEHNVRVEDRFSLNTDGKLEIKSQSMKDCDQETGVFITTAIDKVIDEDGKHKHNNSINFLKAIGESELVREVVHPPEKNCKEKCNSNILDIMQRNKHRVENNDNPLEKDKHLSYTKTLKCTEKKRDLEKNVDDRTKTDREKSHNNKERLDRDKHENEKVKTEKHLNKNEKNINSKTDFCVDKHLEKHDKLKFERHIEKASKDKRDDHDNEKTNKHFEDKIQRSDHHKKDKIEKDKRKDSIDDSLLKLRKDEKHKHERTKKESDSKRESKKEHELSRIRKSSRDETSREISRKDSTDSSTSRTSHDSSKVKDLEGHETKEEIKCKLKQGDPFRKHDVEKDFLVKTVDLKLDCGGVKIKTYIKTEIKEKEDKDSIQHHNSSNIDTNAETYIKFKSEVNEKQRHYSLDSPNTDTKRKERLNSCSSLPPNLGHKRRMSSQESFEYVNEDFKKYKNDIKFSDRRDSKDSRNADRHKTTKFSKGHFAKIIESKTKDDKKNQVKPPDDVCKEYSKEIDIKQSNHFDRLKLAKTSTKETSNKMNAEIHQEGLYGNFDFLATLELRSSEEDEKQKALRKEMKEKKRIQQLQQIQELQMQQDALQQAELVGKTKDDKKHKNEERKKEVAREKRMSTDRKSRDEKTENYKRKNRKVQSSDSSDSDEPKKHSIFDIIDDGPTYISMYDKVKARSCKNMQKQEEEKRQEKIKAKFSQLKQSRAKREEKKRSSWDEDSDSDQDKKTTQKLSIDNSSDDDIPTIKKHEKSNFCNLEFVIKNNEYIDSPADEEHLPNKLTRKNSRSRIISDTSDDESSRRSVLKSPTYMIEVKKECISDSDSLSMNKNDGMNVEDSCDKTKKNSLLTLFGKSDGEDSKTKCNLDINEYKSTTIKSMSHDFSSESESMISCRNVDEFHKKHKKKQKKHKPVYSDDETKIENKDSSIQDSENKHRIIEKQRRHNNKKEKRREKIRDSVDTDDNREDKIKLKKDRKSPNNQCFDYITEISSNCVKKDGKMEDIFGPLSDDSDRDTGLHINIKSDSTFKDHDCNNSKFNTIDPKVNSIDCTMKEKDESKRRKERKRKEKQFFNDDNSLDVDAVSKAIEARLFAESITDDENRITIDSFKESVITNDVTVMNITHYSESKLVDDFINNGKMKKDCKEKRKKKKKSREDRINRKEHHFYNQDKLDKSSHVLSDIHILDESSKIVLFNHSLSNETKSVSDKSDDCKLLSISPSLPRLIDSPPIQNHSDSENKRSGSPYDIAPEDNIILFRNDNKMDTEVMSKSMLLENIEKNQNEVPSTDDVQIKPDLDKTESFVTNFGSESSENAVRSIYNLQKKLDNINEKSIEINDLRVLEKKLDEKPRAVISQEETEDAVAALLGESFGGKVNTFANCYEKPEDICSNDSERVNTTVENENIPEEDAEEMRQAVQNLNASEMEMKPDTPVSDNDLLLIDTDTEDLEESAQDAIERLPINIIATSQSLNTQLEHTKAAEVTTNIIIAKSTPPIQAINTQSRDSPIKLTEAESKVQMAKIDNIQTKTSTATPVITSWTLTNNKILEPRILNIAGNSLPTRDKNENKPPHITTNLVQIKKSQSVQVNSSSLRPIVSAPYQVINHLIRPQVSNLQPPTIKIPEPHILYQKPQNIVISPRLSSNDPRLLSPKATSQAENITSPRLNNMGILNTTSQNLSSGGLVSPNSSIQQRSPGQMTVVRMQQPPLSPIQTVHISHGARAMVSPNRANSVLVQAQRTPIHFNRLPVTPILAPISKQVNLTNIIQQNKNIGVNSSIIHTPKIVTGENKKNDQKNVNETSKIILSPTSLQHSTNPTVMAQNRLISMQNAVHVGNMKKPLHINNKLLINTITQTNDKKDSQILNSEQLCKSKLFSPTPIIHVKGVNHSTASIVQSITNPIVCGLQDSSSLNRSQNSNIIHTNSERIIQSTSLGNVTHLDTNKGNTSSMATSVRPSLIQSNASSPTKTDSINTSYKILKTTNHCEPSQSYMKIDACSSSVQTSTPTKSNISIDDNVKMEENLNSKKTFSDSDLPNKENIMDSTINISKGETDFEELLKDNTNEIKISNDPEKILEVNVGKTVTLFPTNVQNFDTLQNIESVKTEIKKELIEDNNLCVQKLPKEQSSQCIVDDRIDKDISVNKPMSNTATAIQTITTSLGIIQTNDMCSATIPAATENKKLKLEINVDNQECLPKSSKIDEIGILPKQTTLSETVDNQLKSIEENDTWNTNDLNIESVIKKVDSLCNENTDFNDNNPDENKKDIRQSSDSDLTVFVSDKILDTPPSTVLSNNFENSITDPSTFQETIIDKHFPAAKRGGRSLRGKKIDKSQDRVQTRQISKASRGTATGKRGRGRGKVDKKIKNFVKINSNNIPGDVYDFHEDSGDETAASLTKTEVRPRLILTIKSPLSGNSNMTATSTLSITQKDQNKMTENLNKEEKVEDFISPSLNTRKSRRLQEKDVQRSSVDEVIEDVVKVTSAQAKIGKETNKKKPTRLIVAKAMQPDKASVDTRKSPRGVKRARDRSLSDASVDSGDEKLLRKDDDCTVAKVPRLQEPTAGPGEESDTHLATRIVTSSTTTIHPVVHSSAVVSATAAASMHVDGPEAASVLTPPTVLTTNASYPGPSGVPTPITKPPKKMILEMSAKLACAFEAQQQASGGEAQHGGEAAPGRRAHDSVPPALMPVGATEASDARVLSPALPHRPPSTPLMPSVPSTPSVHRPADRATPILVRNGEGEGASGAVTGVAAAASARGYRAYLGTASLPRGAHHPPPDPLHHHVKQVAVVGPHLRHHHPGTASRVTVTNVPSISPQGQMSLSADLVRSPPPAHQQTSPIISGEGMYPHFSHQHYQMYQQHFRATQQEIRTSASPITRSLEAEGCEAPTPPLELRRPPSARVPRPAHSPAPLPSHPPQERLIMYGASVGGAGTGTRCTRSPPPAHGITHSNPHGAVHAAHGVPHMSVHGVPHVPAHVPSHASAHVTPHGPRAAGALPSTTAQGPPHASQVPREADSLQMLLRRYPVMWQGLLALKNDSAAVQMHFVGGNPGVASDTLSRHADHSTPLLRIAQRMRLEPTQLDQVHRKMKMKNEHCMLLALPCGRDHMDVLQQSTNLTAGFITYLQRKQAAGIVNIAPPGHHQAMFTVHIFPSCDFANENLNRIAPDLMHRVAHIAHLLIVIATV